MIRRRLLRCALAATLAAALVLADACTVQTPTATAPQPTDRATAVSIQAAPTAYAAKRAGGGQERQPSRPTAVGGQAPAGGSDASQSLALEVPGHDVDIVLVRPTDRTVTASVLAYRDLVGSIEYGTSGAYTDRTPERRFPPGQPAEVVVTGLEPDREYVYHLSYRDAASGKAGATAERSFHTQRGEGSAFTFAVQADSHLDSNSNLEVYARTLANERAGQLDFLVDLGDTFMTGKYQPYTAARKQYLAQRYYLGTLAPSPLFLVLGNHDGERAYELGSAAEDQSVWSAGMRRLYFPNPVPDGFYSGNTASDKLAGALQDYYAWEWGDALFIVLDPYWYAPPGRGTASGWAGTLGYEQYAWLKATLERSGARFRFVFIHQLVGGLDSNGRGGAEAAKLYEWGGRNADGSDAFAANRPGWAMPIHDLLVRNGVSVVFHGHDHLYARQELDGVVYQAVPQPSAAGAGAAGNAAEYGYVSGDVRPGSGYLSVTVTAADSSVAFIRTSASQAPVVAGPDFAYTVRPAR